MSLLNEALRKSRAKDRVGTAAWDMPHLRKTGFKRMLLSLIVAVTVAAAGFSIWIWVRHMGIFNTSPVLNASSRGTPQDAPAVMDIPEIKQPPETGAAAVTSVISQTGNIPTVEAEKIFEATSQITVPKKKSPDKAPGEKETAPEKPVAIEKTIATDMDKSFQKALQLHRDGRLKEAVAIYQDILKNRPDHHDAICNLSSAYIELSEFSSAYSLLNAHLKSGMADKNMLLNLAISEIGLGNNMGAINHLNEIDGADEDLNFRKYFHLGVASSRDGQSEAALMYYKDAEKIMSGNPDLLYNMAILYDRLERYNEALNYYMRYLAGGSSTPDETAALKGRIQILQSYISRAGADADR